MNNKFDQKEHELDIIASKIGHIEYEQPGPALLNGVMGSISPKKRTLWSRFKSWFSRPDMFLTSWKMVPVAAACAAVLMVLVLKQTDAPAPGPVLDQVAQAPMEGLQNADATHGIKFRLELPQAESVALVGSFNDWQPDGFKMYKDKDLGVWVITVPIEQGRHRYNFLVDGKELIADPGAVVNEPDGFGNFNSVLYVDASHESSI